MVESVIPRQVEHFQGDVARFQVLLSVALDVARQSGGALITRINAHPTAVVIEVEFVILIPPLNLAGLTANPTPIPRYEAPKEMVVLWLVLR